MLRSRVLQRVSVRKRMVLDAVQYYSWVRSVLRLCHQAADEYRAKMGKGGWVFDSKTRTVELRVASTSWPVNSLQICI